ncbi:MAG: hypothetical protein ACLQRH_28460, partial [Acidimicrobiales bacterium]
MTVVSAERPEHERDAGALTLPPPEYPSVGALLDAPTWETGPAQVLPAPARTKRVPAEERPWPAWRVRLTFVVSFTLVGIPIFAVMLWFWGNSRPGHGTAARVVDAFSYIWVLLAIPVLLNVIGVLSFRNVNKEKADAFPVGVAVCFRIVTRGTNVDAVLKSTQAVQAAMVHTPLFPFSVEVVTDNPLPYMHNVRTILVPKHFRTSSRARYKARALHYALEISPISDRTWLFHLDEETHITPSV